MITGQSVPGARGDTTLDAWEAAYLRFETPDQEVRKFRRRLTKLGARGWAREARILELFCGRGNGLRALASLGFKRVCGVDLSAALLGRIRDNGSLVLADCRDLPFTNASHDFVIIHGGLHHLPRLPRDFDQTISEVRRVLRDGGRLVAVEPWRTPFLSIVHRLTENAFVRRISPRFDALATMIELEGETYETWLDLAGTIRRGFESAFRVEVCRAEWGKLLFVGEKK